MKALQKISRESINKNCLKIISIKRLVKLLLILCCFIFSNTLSAQKLSDSTLPKKIVSSVSVPVVNDMDANDFLKKIFKGKHQPKDSGAVKAKKIYATFFPAVGYTLQTELAAIMSVGLAFYTDTAANQKLSNLLTSATYTEYNQFLFPIAADIWTKKNKFNIIFDYRFLKYPSTTYGLGARTKETDAYILDFNYIKLHQTVLKKIHKNLYAGIGFYYDYFWNITEVNPPTGVTTSFQKYSHGKQTETGAGIAFRLLYDSRQNQINPTNGSYFNIVYRPNYTFLSSDGNWQSLQIDYRRYLKLFGSTKNVLALWSFDWFTLGKTKPPYLLLPSTGWDDQYNTGRGYIQSRFKARDMIYLEAEYRFGITNNGLLGAVIFANAQSFSRNLPNQISSNQIFLISPGFGAGLRIKLNKYSNTNLCVDYGFGLNGSKGLFLNLGEVF